MNSINWLKKLIRFDTISSHSNLDLISAIGDWLDSFSIATHLTYDETQIKANLCATIPAYDGSTAGGLVLSGHTDVVPVVGQDWMTDPFVAEERNGALYGRGACDMKGFISVILALMPHFNRLKLKKPLHFAFSYDEEVGCLGAPHLIADLKARHIHPEACIVGEPTNMQRVVAHKGIQVFCCRVHGVAMHSSLTNKGCNAIEHAADLITEIRRLGVTLQAEQDSHFDVPFTTITTNLIQGGIATNIIPSFCEMKFEFRNLPSLKPSQLVDQIKSYIDQSVLPKMQKESLNAGIEFLPLGSVPAFEAASSAAITQLVEEILQDDAIHKVSYATEAGLFESAGIPTILCGPGSITEAHRPNEFIMLEQLRLCEQFLKTLVQRFNT